MSSVLSTYFNNNRYPISFGGSIIHQVHHPFTARKQGGPEVFTGMVTITRPRDRVEEPAKYVFQIPNRVLKFHLEQMQTPSNWHSGNIRGMGPEVLERSPVSFAPDGQPAEVAVQRAEKNPLEGLLDRGVGELDGMVGLSSARAIMHMLDIPGYYACSSSSSSYSAHLSGTARAPSSHPRITHPSACHPSGPATVRTARSPNSRGIRPANVPPSQHRGPRHRRPPAPAACHPSAQHSEYDRLNLLPMLCRGEVHAHLLIPEDVDAEYQRLQCQKCRHAQVALCSGRPSRAGGACKLTHIDNR